MGYRLPLVVVNYSVLCEDKDYSPLTAISKFYHSNQMKVENKTATVHSSLTASSLPSVSPHHTVGLVGKLIAELHLLH